MQLQYLIWEEADMPHFDIFEKDYSLAEQTPRSLATFIETFHPAENLRLNQHNLSPRRDDDQASRNTQQKTRLPAGLLQQIIQLITDPSTNISPKDISQKLTQLVEEKKFRRQHQFQFSQLTAREKEVLLKLAMGFTNRKIAVRLSISLETVKHHRKIIKSKLEANSTADFIRYVQAFNLTEPAG